MARSTPYSVTLTLALVWILGSSVVQAQRYGVNRTISKTVSVSECGDFSCDTFCAPILENHCQQVAPGFCNSGDLFVSSSFGGVSAQTSCDVDVTTDPEVCYFEHTKVTGTANCVGSCNALCETNPYCECDGNFDCFLLYGDPGFGTWECLLCECILTNSPLVLHLPDYLSGSNGKSGSQNWWRKGFCGADTPTVCLDWAGDGRQTCTAWFEPGSENAFIVNLSDEDMLNLLEWSSIRAEPWRHLFGNVTQGPGGDRPYEHGFGALAEYCGQDPDADSQIDLTQCGESLFVWDDRNVDANIDIEELLEFQELGITALGDVRKTGKTDKCGNTLPVESNAICDNGKCGTVLDIFFRLRQ